MPARHDAPGRRARGGLTPGRRGPEIGDPAGRYAEHRTQKGKEVYYYQGTDFIRDVETECRREMTAYFGCSDVELRPISGQMSNEVVFKAMLKYLSKKNKPTLMLSLLKHKRN